MELKATDTWPEKPEACEVSVLYDQPSSRDSAIHLCRSLSNHFRDDPEFSFAWWNFKYLDEPALAREAAKSIQHSDLIILSTGSDQELPPKVQALLEESLTLRAAREGAITALTQIAQHPGLQASPLGQYLNAIAERNNLDFLSPASLLSEDAWETFRTREREVTPVLDEILSRSKPSPRWGLNE